MVTTMMTLTTTLKTTPLHWWCNNANSNEDNIDSHKNDYSNDDFEDNSDDDSDNTWVRTAVMNLYFNEILPQKWQKKIFFEGVNDRKRTV